MSGTLYEQKNKASPDYPYKDKYRRNLSNPPHYHDDIELIFVLPGSVTVYCSFGALTAKEGDIAVLMPKEVHNFSTKTPKRIQKRA